MLKTIICLGLLGTSIQANANCDPPNSDFPESLVSATNTTGIQTAWYDGATDRYSHGVLGDAIEPSILSISTNTSCDISITLDEQHVFEDIAPRLADIDNNGTAEVITVRSHQNKGAQVAIYTLGNESTLELLATTPYIGTANRWLAPVGIADFNNDGVMDIAFVDRPHLAKKLRVWSYKDSELKEIASKGGYSNHRIGEAFISGGIRLCNGTTEMITADAYWQRILSTKLINGELLSEDIGTFNGTASLTMALQCP